MQCNGPVNMDPNTFRSLVIEGFQPADLRDYMRTKEHTFVGPTGFDKAACCAKADAYLNFIRQTKFRGKPLPGSNSKSQPRSSANPAPPSNSVPPARPAAVNQPLPAHKQPGFIPCDHPNHHGKFVHHARKDCQQPPVPQNNAPAPAHAGNAPRPQLNQNFNQNNNYRQDNRPQGHAGGAQPAQL